MGTCGSAEVKKPVRDVTQTATGATTQATGAATSAVGQTTGAATGAAQSTVATAGGAVDDVTGGATSGATGAVADATGAATGAVDDVTGAATGAVDDVVGAATGAVDDAVAAAADVADEAIGAPHKLHAQAMEQFGAKEIIMISGCMDSQTSADVGDAAAFRLPEQSGPGGAGGACTSALLHQEYKPGELSWMALLTSMREYLEKKGYSQIPQLSSSSSLDLKRDFNIVGESAGKNMALMVGINYTGTSAQLGGCVNDVVRMRRYLDQQGFQGEDVRILVDPLDADGVDELGTEPQLPTKENIMAGIQWLTDNAKAGDCIFFHYSGHGTQVTDTDGDEEDGKDEALCPMDYTTAGFITDDDIFDQLVQKLPEGVRLFALMDCCHSGTIFDLPYTFVADAESLQRVGEEGAETATAANHGFLSMFGKKIEGEVGKLMRKTGLSSRMVKPVTKFIDEKIEEATGA